MPTGRRAVPRRTRGSAPSRAPRRPPPRRSDPPATVRRGRPRTRPCECGRVGRRGPARVTPGGVRPAARSWAIETTPCWRAATSAMMASGEGVCCCCFAERKPRITPPPSRPPQNGTTRNRVFSATSLYQMCRNIRQLHNFEPPATHEEIHASALQYVRKISGSTKPSQANQEAFDRADRGGRRRDDPPARPPRDQRASEEP